MAAAAAAMAGCVWLYNLVYEGSDSYQIQYVLDHGPDKDDRNWPATKLGIAADWVKAVTESGRPDLRWRIGTVLREESRCYGYARIADAESKAGFHDEAIRTAGAISAPATS